MAPLVVLLLVVGWVAYNQYKESDSYVLYKGERYPPAEASKHACHLINKPEMRCFDDWEEALADVKSNFPAYWAGMSDLLAASPDPGMPIQ